jgi:hypothetical protein
MSDSAMRALLSYNKKQIKKSVKKKKKRTGVTPEKMVEKDVMHWLSTNGFSCNVVESKAVYSAQSGRYLRGQTDAGFPDICGCSPNGLGVFIELKAKGRRSTLKDHQRAFLIDKINRGAFAVCVDSVDCLRDISLKFKHSDHEARKELLLNHLPVKKKAKEELSFFD